MTTPDMKPADFKLHPLQGSKFHFRIRIWDTKEGMERAAVADGSLIGKAKACFCGAADRKAICAGDVYLWDNPTLRLDAVHELTHAAVHYVREVRRGDLAIPNHGEYASAAEELLCRTMESLLGEFFLQFNEWIMETAQRKTPQPRRNQILRVLQRPLPVPVSAFKLPKVPAGYSAEELERDNPYNAWVSEGA